MTIPTVIKVVPMPGVPGPKGNNGSAGATGPAGIQGPPGENGTPGTVLPGIKTVHWSYPTTNAYAIQNETNGEAISLKSSQSAALRWHVRDGGQSLAISNIIPVSVAGISGTVVTFNVQELDYIPPANYFYTVNVGNGILDGMYICTHATISTISLDYTTSITGDYTFSNTSPYINPPAVYNEVKVNSNGITIGTTSWNQQTNYTNYWNFKNNASIEFPYQHSNNRTGWGEVLKFGNQGQQSIISGPSTTLGSPTAQRLVIAGQDGYTGTTGEGGDLYLWAGRGGDAGGTGGDIKLDGGDGYLTGEGGTVKMRGGYSPNGLGGFIEIRAGGTYDGTGGPVNIYSGYSSLGVYGNIGLNSGNGDVNINANNFNITTSTATTFTTDALFLGSITTSYVESTPSSSLNLIGDIDLTVTSYSGDIVLTPAVKAYVGDKSIPGNEIATLSDLVNVSLVAAPETSGSVGSLGQISYDSAYIYICVGTDTWVRTARDAW